MILRIIIFLLLLTVDCFADTQKVTLRLQWKHQFEFAGFYAAKELGYYREAGLDVEILENDQSIDPVAEVLSGKVDFGIWGSSIIEQGMQGVPIVMLANYFKRSPLVLATQPEIRLPSELAGKKLMISELDIKNTNYTQMFHTFNIDTDTIKRVPPSFSIDDFVEKKVDGISIFLTNEPFLLLERGIPHNIIDPNNYGVELYDVNLFTSKTLLDNQPALTDAFVQASNRGWEYALEHPEEIVEFILKKYNSQKKSRKHLLFEAHQTVRIIQPATYPIGSIDLKQVERIANLFIEVGLAKAQSSYSFIYNQARPTINMTPEEKAFAASHQTVSITMMPDFTPFSFETDNTIIGFEHDLLATLEQKTGLTFVPEYAIWNKGLSEFKAKRADMISSISYKKERTPFTLFTDPYYQIPIMIYTRDDFGKYENLDSLKGSRVGILKDVFYTADLEKLGTLDLFVYETYEKLTKALVYGEIDALMQNLTNINAIIKDQAYTNLRIAGELELPEISKEDLRFGIRSDLPLLQSIIQKGMDDITSAEWDSLSNKWLGVQFSEDTESVSFTSRERDYLASKKSIIMCADPDWMPLEGINDEDQHIGIAADIMQEVIKKTNLPITLLRTDSWLESVKAAQQRKCDIFSLAMKTPERTSYMNFSRPYVSFPYVIATRNSEIFIDNIKALKQKRIAVVRGYASADIFSRDYPDIDIIEVESLMEGIKQLRNEEIFGFIDALPPLASAIQKEGITDIRIAGKINRDCELSIATRKDEPELFTIMQKAIDTVEPATIQSIYNKWLAIRYEDRINYSLLYKVITTFFLIALFGYWRHRTLQQLNKTIKDKNFQLTQAYEKYSWLAENMDDVVWVMNIDGSLIYVSPSVEKLRGYTPEEVVHQSFNERICSSSRQQLKDAMAASLKAARNGITPPRQLFRLEQPCKDGSTVWSEVNARLIVHEKTGEMRFIGLTRDITKTLSYEKELKTLALSDRLTGLYNRHKLDELLKQQFSLAKRYQTSFAVMILDIDHFKQVNDTYGHHVGDNTLIEFSQILQNSVRQSDMVGRWGGEEFLIIIPEADKVSRRKMGEKIRSSIEQHRFDVVGQVTVSIGLAVHKKEEELNNLLSRADTALYSAKQKGRNRLMVAQ